MEDFGLSSAQPLVIGMTYNFNKNSIESEKVLTLILENKIADITDIIRDLKVRIENIEAQDRQDTDVITRLEQSTGSALIIGSYWAVSTASQTGSTLYLSSSIRVFASGLASGTIQGVLAGSGTNIGSPYGPFTIMASGGNF